MDERDKALYDEKIRYIDQRVRTLESFEQRISSLEQWKAGMMASAMRSAFVIGVCSMVGASVAVFLAYLLRVAH